MCGILDIFVGHEEDWETATFVEPPHVSGKHIQPSNHVKIQIHITISYFNANTFFDNRAKYTY
jgi:hypothetical protein